MAYFYSEIGLEVTFETTQQNGKPQMPSSVQYKTLLNIFMVQIFYLSVGRIIVV